VTLPGILMASSAQELRDRRDVLSAALVQGAEGQLFRHSDRFLNCRCQGLSWGQDDGLDSIPWTVRFRTADPLYYEAATQTLPLVLGSNAITAGGGYPPTPIFTFVVTHSGTLTVTHAATGQSFVLTLSATGTYVVDCQAGTVIKNGTTDVIDEFSGEFFDQGLAKGASTITLTAGASLTINTSGTQVQWVRCYTNG
jgi:hypothetical protein